MGGETFDRGVKDSLHACFDHMRYHDMGKQFLSRIIATDEVWCHHFDRATKSRMEWRHPSSPLPKKARSSTRASKVMLTCFFEVDGPFLLKWLPTGTTVNVSKALYRDGLIPPKTKFVGYARSNLKIDDIKSQALPYIK
ncbi:hypothetical protein NPIL_580461, partial [Nephila pilipes]